MSAKKNETNSDGNVPNFADRLIFISEDAYPGEDADSVHIEKHLVEIFTDGVIDNANARKLKLRPETLDRVVEIATQEQQTSRAFEPMHEQTPMEIEALGQTEQTLEQRINNLTTEVDTTLSMVVVAVQNNQQSQKSEHLKDTPQKLYFKKKYEFTKVVSQSVITVRVCCIYIKCSNRNNQEN